jgi:hypothetical protein
VRVELPVSLCRLAGTGRELLLAPAQPVTQRTLLDALEQTYPALRGTIRDQVTHRRRPFIRFIAGREDLSHAAPDDPLPAAIAEGAEPFMIVGAIAGG